MIVINKAGSLINGSWSQPHNYPFFSGSKSKNMFLLVNSRNWSCNYAWNKSISESKKDLDTHWSRVDR